MNLALPARGWNRMWTIRKGRLALLARIGRELGPRHRRDSEPNPKSDNDTLDKPISNADCASHHDP